MRCFNHETKDSVVICKACGKALCHECFEEIDLGYACKNDKCVERAKLINLILESNSKVMNVANKQMKSAGIAGTTLGVGFLFFALVSYLSIPDSFLPYFLVTSGLIFLISGLFRLQKKHLYPEIKNKITSED